MIKPKEKPCKGLGIARGYGCGKLTMHRINGLGKMCCYSNFLLNSEPGKIKLEKSIIKAKSIVKSEQKAKNKKKREELNPKSYYEALLQKEVNLIVRLIDKGWGCIATGSLTGQMAGGHYLSVGSNPTTRYHLENIWNQSSQSNMWKSGDTLRYQDGIINLYGKEYLERLNSLKSIPPIKLSIDTIKEKISISRGIVKWLKLQDRQFTKEERIELRQRFNADLGIYTE